MAPDLFNYFEIQRHFTNKVRKPSQFPILHIGNETANMLVLLPVLWSWYRPGNTMYSTTSTVYNSTLKNCFKPFVYVRIALDSR